MNNPIYPFARPMYIMLKPAGAACNLACDYCYYLEKSALYPQSNKKILTDSLLEKFTEEYIKAQTTNNVLFTWHGGETLLRPISFYERAIELQNKYSNGKQIDNVIQTNGTLLNDKWCEFFKKNNFLVGISIDGPQVFHDEYRTNRQGYGSFPQVMRGIHLLQKHHVEFNAMAVINDYNADHPQEFYQFFKDIGCKYIQFAPIVERQYYKSGNLATPDTTFDEVRIADFSITAKQWGDFLISLFNEWVQKDVGNIFIQIFDATLANWVGVTPGLCTLAKKCGHAAAMEFNGDLYSCDHFVFPEYRLGNINDKSLLAMMNSPEQIQFGNDKYDSLTKQCKECEYLFACYGECPKNRFIKTNSGEDGLNYLCSGFYRFFDHVAPFMDYMKLQLQNELPPANIMEHIKSNPSLLKKVTN